MKSNILLAVLTVMGLVGNVFAGPSDYISTPNVEYGEKEIDFKFGTLKQRNQERVSATSLGFGYGATQFWFTELYLKYKREGGDPTRFDAWEWENKFQLK